MTGVDGTKITGDSLGIHAKEKTKINKKKKNKLQPNNKLQLEKETQRQ